jgi:hypothetical protein
MTSYEALLMNSLVRELLNSTTAADRILFSLLIVLSFSGMIFLKEALPKNPTVQIEVDGKPVYILPADKNRIVSVEGHEGTTVIEIKDRSVRVNESPCTNKLCVQKGWIKSGVIVCLPNRVVIRIGGHNKDNKSVDAITG